MGQILSFPVISKFSTSGGNGRLLYSTTAMQGWRIHMEDAHAAELSLDQEVENSNAFFAVYDGHGGDSVAKFAGINVHRRLVTEEAYREKHYEEALKRAFLGTDEDLLATIDPRDAPASPGCTVVAALVTGDGKIYIANAGDSRSVISVKGEVKPLSFDHKPSNETEKARIITAGGYIGGRRVNGMWRPKKTAISSPTKNIGRLALSRALGDFEFKQNSSLTPENQIITADPDVTLHHITEEDEFLVLACDGIWECLSSQEVVNFVRLKISEGTELREIGEMMCDHCLAPDSDPLPHVCYDLMCDRCFGGYSSINWDKTGHGCDNMTVVIVAILNGRTKEEWFTWVTDRVRQNYGYRTPKSLPYIYAPDRLRTFKARRAVQEEHDRRRGEQGSMSAEQSDSGDSGIRSGLEALSIGGSADVGTVEVGD